MDPRKNSVTAIKFANQNTLNIYSRGGVNITFHPSELGCRGNKSRPAVNFPKTFELPTHLSSSPLGQLLIISSHTHFITSYSDKKYLSVSALCWIIKSSFIWRPYLISDYQSHILVSMPEFVILCRPMITKQSIVIMQTNFLYHC